MSGPLAFVGGGEWQSGCDFDERLLAAGGGEEVVILAAAAAYEHPDRSVIAATQHFSQLGAKVIGLDVFQRPGALVAANADVVRKAKFIYLSDGSPLHLRSVLKSTPLWEALVASWKDGAVIAGSGAGAMVLGDPMVDPRGGAFTVGLGLISGVAIYPNANDEFASLHQRTLALADPGLRLVAIAEQTALIRSSEGSWSVEGAGFVKIYIDGKESPLTVLP